MSEVEKSETTADKVLNGFTWEKLDHDVFYSLNKGNTFLSNLKILSIALFIIFLSLICLFNQSYPMLHIETIKFLEMSTVILFVFCSFILVHIFSWFLHRGIFLSIIKKYHNFNKLSISHLIMREFLCHEIKYIKYKLANPKKKPGKGYDKSKDVQYRFIQWFSFKTLVLVLFTPDYFWAELYKRNLGLMVSRESILTLREQNRIKCFKKFYIERSNWINLIFSILGIFVIILNVMNSSNQTLYIHNYYHTNMQWFVLFFICYRILSRVLEIIIAFYNDIVSKRDKIFFYRVNDKKNNDDSIFSVVNSDFTKGFLFKDKEIIETYIESKNAFYIYPWKNSLLLPSARTSLALHSLLELTIIFGCLYFVFSELNISPENLVDIGNTGIFKYFLYSFSIAITLPDITPSSFWAIPQFFQILSSLILVVMSVAYYLGAEYKVSDRENELYKNFKVSQLNAHHEKYLQKIKKHSRI